MLDGDKMISSRISERGEGIYKQGNLTWAVLSVDDTQVVLGVEELEQLLRRDGLHRLPESVAILRLELLGVDDHLLQLSLGCRALHDLLVDGVLGNQAEDADLKKQQKFR